MVADANFPGNGKIVVKRNLTLDGLLMNSGRIIKRRRTVADILVNQPQPDGNNDEINDGNNDANDDNDVPEPPQPHVPSPQFQRSFLQVNAFHNNFRRRWQNRSKSFSASSRGI